MRRIFLLAIAILFLAGTVYAGITYDPKTGGPQVLMPIYNNDTTTLAAGDVVVLDIGSSTGDNDMYVVDTSTAATGIVAGVVWPNQIAAASVGSVITYGMAECDVTGTMNAGDLICTSTTAGEGTVCAALTDEHAAYAIVSETGTDTLVNCFVNVGF